MTSRNPRKTVNILQVNTDSTSMDGVLRKIQSSLEKEQQIFISTPNPEIVLKTLEDQVLRQSINNSDIKVPDGIGLAAAAKFLDLNKTNNKMIAPFLYFVQGAYVGSIVVSSPEKLNDSLKIIKGRALFLELIKIANKKSWKVYLLGGRDNTSCEAKKELENSYKKIKIKCSDGPILDSNAVPLNKDEKENEQKIINEINEFKPDILFVGFGAPKQEKWIAKWKENLETDALMVVGGTFDYYAGNLRLPPKWVDERGLEWLWRLVNQPMRVLRIFNAVVRFSWNIYLYKIDRSK